MSSVAPIPASHPTPFPTKRKGGKGPGEGGKKGKKTDVTFPTGTSAPASRTPWPFFFFFRSLASRPTVLYVQDFLTLAIDDGRGCGDRKASGAAEWVARFPERRYHRGFFPRTPLAVFFFWIDWFRFPSYCCRVRLRRPFCRHGFQRGRGEETSIGLVENGFGDRADIVLYVCMYVCKWSKMCVNRAAYGLYVRL